MAESGRTNIVASALLAAGLILGLLLGGWILGSQIKDVRLADRYVSVRGLAERTVHADLAIWPLSFREAGNDLKTTYAKSEQDSQAVLQFLAAQGIPQADITLGQPGVTDTQANDYGGARAPNRYIVQQSITVRSNDVNKVAAAVQKTSALIAAGVVLGGGPQYGQQNSVSYLYTGLNSIKPEMITEATRNARVAAERFAADSGSKVGTIRQASQGLFSISSADAASSEGNSNMGGGSSNASILQKVRVVTSIQYYLQQ
ncbi:MAG: SIMPL domain-containing protein [Acidobacteriaceae bacterium]